MYCDQSFRAGIIDSIQFFVAIYLVLFVRIALPASLVEETIALIA